MSKGIFITIEGPDGAGKSTQIHNIKAYFDERKIDSVFTREPGGTDISENLRSIILDPENVEMSPRAEALLYAASRAQLVDQVIKPALESGKSVVCDRYIDSSIAYQGYGRGLGSDVLDINTFAVNGVMPDITFLMSIDPEAGKKRLNQGTLDRMETEKIEFHRRVYEGFLDLADIYPDRIKVIDAEKGKDAIKEEIAYYLDRIFFL